MCYTICSWVSVGIKHWQSIDFLITFDKYALPNKIFPLKFFITIRNIPNEVNRLKLEFAQLVSESFERIGILALYTNIQAFILHMLHDTFWHKV